MRASYLLSWTATALLAASPVSAALFGGNEGNSVGSLIKKDEEDATGQDTIFNGKTVPPMAELEGDKIDDTIKDGYWMVEYFSPYCHHCKAFAPILQTLYEFYYTSNPVPQIAGSGETDTDMNSFTRYYNFKFAKVDCVAFADACVSHEIGSFPTVILYKDGKEIEKRVGQDTLPNTSKWLEKVLETIKPGSRPQGGPKLPKVGAKEAPPQPVIEALVAKEGDAKVAAGAAKETLTGTRVVEPSRQTPNPMGKSTTLTAENFQRLVTTTHDPWFIKFYAPWCHHCQAMAPSWAGMAKQTEGRLNVGEVNCESEKRLC